MGAVPAVLLHLRLALGRLRLAAAKAFEARRQLFVLLTKLLGTRFEPLAAALERLIDRFGARRQAALEHDILETVARFDTATDGSMRVPSEYAEVVVQKR